MRHLLTLAVLFSLPASALAAYSTPLEVLGKTRHDNVPREFQAKAHNNDGDTFLTAWVSGAQEGTGEWLKMRMNVTTHMRQGNDFVALKAKAMVHHGMLYYTITDATLQTHDELTKTTLNSMLKKWVAMPVPSWVDMGSSWNFIDLLSAIDMDLLSMSDAWDFVRSSADGFTMEHTSYQGGHAYSLKHTAPHVNAHIKINTTKAGAFTYGKYYLSHGHFALEGSMQPHGSPVYLEVPAHTVSPGEFSMHLLGFEFPMMYGSVPITTEWTPLKYEDPVPEQKPPQRMPRINTVNYTEEPEIPESRSYVEYAKKSGKSQETFYQCAWPGTPDAVELERKGVCPTKRLYKRDINRMNEKSLTGRELRELRASDQRVLDNYDHISQKLEDAAHSRDFHRVKTMLSRLSIVEVGSDTVDDWLNNDVLPFFASVMRTSVVEYLFIEGSQGTEGVALEKMAITETGRRRNFVVILFMNPNGGAPVIADIYLDAKLRDLRADGVIE